MDEDRIILMHATALRAHGLLDLVMADLARENWRMARANLKASGDHVDALMRLIKRAIKAEEPGED